MQALEGLRVVEVANGLTGAQIGQFLADFGAEVVLVEPPGGSPLRRQPAFPAWGRGHKSIELDLHRAADAGVAHRLLDRADVFVETWRPGVAERLGFGY